MPLSITPTFRKLLAVAEKVTNGKLNQMLDLAYTLAGTLDTSQLTDRAVTAAKLEYGAVWWGTDSGTANAHAVAITSGISAYATGQLFAYKANTTNTGAVTANFTPSVSGVPLGAKDVKRQGAVALAAGDIRSGQVVVLRYDGTNLQLLNPAGNTEVVVGVDAGSTDDYVITPTPSVTAWVTGQFFLFKAATANTGACTLAPSGLAAKTLKKNVSADLVTGDIAAGQWVLCVYDGTNLQVLNRLATSDPATLVAATRNLIATINATHPTYQVDVDADEIVLKNSDGVSRLASAVNLTLDITSYNSLNGLETGKTETSGQWYYVWVISDGTNVRGVISESSTSPDLSHSAFTGYGYKAMVGVFRNSGAAEEGAAAGDIVPFYQHDRKLWVNDVDGDEVLLFNNHAGTAAYAALAGADATLFAKLVPPIAKRAAGTMGISGAGSAATDYSIALAGDTSGLGVCVLASPVPDGGSMNSFIASAGWEVPLKTAQNLAWKTADTDSMYRICVTGYTI